MKIRFLSFLVIAMSMFGSTAFSQESDTGELGLPGDNLDLYAVLDLFQKSKTIEDFEKSLNDEKAKINNLDLNGDKKVDFIKVETKKDGDDFTFILRDPISKSDTQDVAVIFVSKDKEKKVSLQIVGDKDLYGKDYIVEPTPKGSGGVTSNPAYTGSNPVTVNVPAPTTTVVVEQAPIVQYVYSPAYAPYYPPYYYGYYPPYFAAAAFTVMAVGIYRHNHYHYHGHGGGYGHSNVYINHNSYNNYNNNSRNSANNISRDNINNSRNNNINNSRNNNNLNSSRDNKASASTRDGNRSSSSGRDANRASASTRDGNKSSSANRPSASTRDGSRSSSSSRPSSSNSMSSSRFNSGGSSSFNRGSSGGSYRSGGGGGGYRGGGGGGFSGGGGRRR